MRDYEEHQNPRTSAFLPRVVDQPEYGRLFSPAILNFFDNLVQFESFINQCSQNEKI